MCHPERSEGSRFLAQGKLREGSHRINKIENRDSSLPAGRQGLTPQNDILEQPDYSHVLDPNIFIYYCNDGLNQRKIILAQRAGRRWSMQRG